MKRFMVLGILLFSLAGFGLMSGCDKNDSPTKSIVGDTLSPQFQFIDSTFGEEMFEGFDQSIELSLELLSDTLGPLLAASKDNPILSLQGESDIIISSVDSIVFTDSKWWVFYFDATITDDNETMYISGADSVQLLLGTTPLSFLDYHGEPDFDVVKARAQVEGTNNDDFSLGFHHRIVVAVEEIASDSLITISGTTNDMLDITLVGDQQVCDIMMSQQLNISGLEIFVRNGMDDCIQDGSITASFTIDISCTGGGEGSNPFDELDILGTWVVTAVINDDETATFTYTHGNTYWQVTKEFDCTS